MKFDTCKSCGAQIVWLQTVSDEPKPMPVNAASVTEGDMLFNPTRHMTHFATCPHSKQWRKPAEQPSLLPEGEKR